MVVSSFGPFTTTYPYCYFSCFFFFLVSKRCQAKCPWKPKSNFEANQLTHHHLSKQQRIIVSFGFSFLLRGPVQVVWPELAQNNSVQLCSGCMEVGLSQTEEVRKSLQAEELWSVMSLFASVQASLSCCIITKMWVWVGWNKHTLMWGGHW